MPQQVAELLNLTAPLLHQHTNRQPIHALVSTLDTCAGAVKNIVGDIALMCQLAEPTIKGMGRSSSMPRKRNPVLCALIKAATLRMHEHLSIISNTTVQPFERALRQWHASQVPFSDGLALVAESVAYLKTFLQKLQVNLEHMAVNFNSDAYLSQSLKRYFASNQNQIYLLIAQTSQQAYQEHKGFLATFVSLLTQPSIDLTIIMGLRHFQHP